MTPHGQGPDPRVFGGSSSSPGCRPRLCARLRTGWPRLPVSLLLAWWAAHRLLAQGICDSVCLRPSCLCVATPMLLSLRFARPIARVLVVRLCGVPRESSSPVYSRSPSNETPRGTKKPSCFWARSFHSNTIKTVMLVGNVPAVPTARGDCVKERRRTRRLQTRAQPRRGLVDADS